MKNKILIIISIFCLGFSNTKMENPCSLMTPRGGDEDWGIGGYLIPDKFEANIYKDTSGLLYGKFKTSNSYLRLKDIHGKGLNITYGDIEWIGHYSNELIKVKECENSNFVKVLWKTSNSNLYMNKKEIEDKGAKFYHYKSLLFKDEIPSKIEGFYDWVNIGINIEKSCLNLRKEPSVKAKKILCIPGNDWENISYWTHLEILEDKGDWAKVEYTEQHPHLFEDESGEDCGFIEKNRQIGWVKAIDKSGFPNIWFSVTGY